MNLKNIYHGARQLSRTLGKKIARRVLHWRLASQDQASRYTAERKLRGAQQYQTLQQADIVVVSFGKSGRTWLRVMLSEVFRVMYQLPADLVIGFDNFHSLNKSVPKIFFTHDNYIKDFTGAPESKAPFYGKKVILLARDPRDVSVSNYFQWKFRMKPGKKIINNYPPEASPISVCDYLLSDYGGSLPDIVNFLNIWAKEAPSVKEFHLLRYEDLRSDTVATLRDLLGFMQVPATEAQVLAAVDYSSYDNMKRREEKPASWLAGRRMAPGDKNNPDSFKVRRAKVGGYRDYFESDAEVDRIDDFVRSRLDKLYGYSD